MCGEGARQSDLGRKESRRQNRRHRKDRRRYRISFVIWFGMPFLRTVLKRGGIYVFRGKVEPKNGRLYLEQPEYFSLASYEKMLHAMQPIYGLTKGLTNKTVTKAVRQILEQKSCLKDYFPEDFRRQYGLEDYGTSLMDIHFPSCFDMLKKPENGWYSTNSFSLS